MTKTSEELNNLKKELNDIKEKFKSLSEDELKYVTGGDVTSANIVGYNNINRINPDEHNIMIGSNNEN